MVLYRETKFNEISVNLEVTEKNKDDYWAIKVNGTIVYPRETQGIIGAIRYRVAYNEIIHIYKTIVQSLKLGLGYTFCEMCSEYHLDVKQYKVHFMDEENHPDYHIAEYCTKCLEVSKNNSDTIKVELVK